MTPTQRALRIIDAERSKPGRFTCGDFAALMWPDSEAWTKVTRCGRGSHAGKGMWLCAGSLLAKLRIRGLIWGRLGEGVGLTGAGRTLLDAAVTGEKD